MQMLSKIGLGLLGVGTLLVLTHKPSAAATTKAAAPVVPKIEPPPPPPPTIGDAAKPGDEVAVTRESVATLEDLPANAGGAVLQVTGVTSTTVRGFVVAFVGTGGAADLPAPEGPIELPKSAVSAILIAPPDRTGRFAIIGDDVVVSAQDPSVITITPDQLDTLKTTLQPGDVVDTLTIRVKQMLTAPGAPTALQGEVIGYSFTGPGRSGSSSINTAPGAPPPPQSGPIQKGAVRQVVRGGVLVAPLGGG